MGLLDGHLAQRLLGFFQSVETGEKSYQCKKCPERFEVVASLKNHERFHFEEEPFQCNICLKSFWLKSYRAGCMKSHERIM